MADVKPSGPLWTMAEWMQHDSIVAVKDRVTLCGEDDERIPVRVIPGHGKVVPLELVEAIEQAWGHKIMFDNRLRDEVSDWVDAAIRAAIEGAL